MSEITQALSNAGVSIWLDDLSRERIQSGNLQMLIDSFNVVGVTTNPSIFQAAITNDPSYKPELEHFRAIGIGVDDVIMDITSEDVAAACDVFLPVWEKSNHVDGRVSIEVSPDLAYDTHETIDQAVVLWERINRPNLMIKIPATKEGLEAITAVTAKGISVNVTLIFSNERYQEVIDAYLTGLEAADKAGIDLATIYSVASFFVSRVDTEVDARLQEIAPDSPLKSKIAIANARLAAETFFKAFATDRAKSLLEKGANKQRPLWASTGVKDPALPETYYVDNLIMRESVNTMPEKTLKATAVSGSIELDTASTGFAEARNQIAELASLGINIEDVTAKLEREGVDKFIAAWADLKETVSKALSGS